MPMLRFQTGTPVTSAPAMRTSPASGATKPATMRRSVVLPEPDGPSRLVKRLLAKRMLTGSSTRSGAEILGDRVDLNGAHPAPPILVSQAKASTSAMETASRIVEIALISGVKPLRIAE